MKSAITYLCFRESTSWRRLGFGKKNKRNSSITICSCYGIAFAAPQPCKVRHPLIRHKGVCLRSDEIRGIPLNLRAGKAISAFGLKRSKSSSVRAKITRTIVSASALVILVASSVFTQAYAAYWYVRPDGGTGAGTSWAAAWNGLGGIAWGSIIPGDTIYLAGGTYTQSLSVQAAGTSASRINIKRATASEHGTDTGWSSDFDTQVFLTNGGGIRFPTRNGADYVTLDGVVPNGIRVNYLDGNNGVDFIRGSSYVTLKYLQLVGPGKDQFQNNSTRGIDITAWHGSGYDDVDHLTISHCDISHSDTLIQSVASNYITVEYSIIHDAGAANPQTWHPNSYYVGFGCNYGTFRYNTLYNLNAEGLFFTGGGQTGWKIYGNLFYDCEGSGRAIEWRQDYTYGTFEIYNNTFANVDCSSGFAPRGPVSGNTYNNIFYNTPGTFSAMSHNNNAFSGSNPESNGISNMPSSAFVNYSGKNFQIVATEGANYPRNKGSARGIEYSVDMLGVTRGADGAWDIGAFEYSSASSPPPIGPVPNSPSGLQVN